MKINRQELVDALEKVRPGLAQREMIEQSTSFAFIGNRIVTYNDEVSISHSVKNLELSGAIKAEELYKLLGKLTDEEIEMKVTETEVLITSGKAKAGLPLQSEIILPVIDVNGITDWKDVPPDFSTALQFCLFSCSTDMSRPVLTCLHFQKEGIVESCDNMRATRYNGPHVFPFDNLLIPGRSIEKLVNYDIEKMSVEERWVHFKTKDDTIFSCRTQEDTYPDLTKILEMEGKKIGFPKKIKDVLDKASIFSKRDFQTDDYVSIELKEKKAVVRSEGEFGWFEEELKVSYSEEPCSFLINPTFLQEICEKLRTCFLTETRIKFIGANWEHVVSSVYKGNE